MKPVQLFLLVMLFPAGLCAQDAIDYALPATPSIDTLPRRVPKYRAVMLVPFDMTYYLSDADNQLASYNRKTLKQIQEAFRYGLDGHLGAAAADLYSTRQILLDTIPEFNRDLNRLRGAVTLRYEKPFGLQPEVPEAAEPRLDPKPGDRIKNIFSKKKDQQRTLQEDGGDAEFHNGMIRGPVEGRKVMHARLRDTTALVYMQERYGTDLFLFVNQFELRTNYEHCLDRATNNFVREITVHFSIYDYRGKLLARDLITVLADSNTNRMQDLMTETFPELAAEVVQGLPASRMIRAVKADLR